MKPSGNYNRMIDVMEELVKVTFLTRNIKYHLVERYSERAESGAALLARVTEKAG